MGVCEFDCFSFFKKRGGARFGRFSRGERRVSRARVRIEERLGGAGVCVVGNEVAAVRDGVDGVAAVHGEEQRLVREQVFHAEGDSVASVGQRVHHEAVLRVRRLKEY